MEKAVIIFVRNPEAGKVKTRLAAALGNEAALAIYKKLLMHTLEITEAMAADKFVFYADEVIAADMWQRPHYYKAVQAIDDLGGRMYSAFDYVLSKGYGKVCIIGSDCYELSSAIIEQAFAFLDGSDVVIGPAKDGGYYLLGMKILHPGLFQNKSWSTDSVLEETLKDIERLKLSFQKLPQLTDVDEAKDVPAAWLTDIKN